MTPNRRESDVQRPREPSGSSSSAATRALVAAFVRSARADFGLPSVRVRLAPAGDREAVLSIPIAADDQRLGFVEADERLDPASRAALEGSAARLAAALLASQAADAHESASRGTILVADDDPGVRALLAIVLGKRGFTVVQAENGRLAFEAAKHDRPDLVVIDWVMPVMDGRETVEQLKNDARTRDIPIVMLTSQATIDDKVAALEAGAQDFLAKPFDQRELVARVEQQMRWRKLLADVPAAPGGSPHDDAAASQTARSELSRHISSAESLASAGRYADAGEAYRCAALSAGRMREAAVANRLLRLGGAMYLRAAEAASDACAMQDGYLNAARCFLITGNLRLAKRSIDAALRDEA
jgi:CheY-like chemotaxis protein